MLKFNVEAAHLDVYGIIGDEIGAEDFREALEVMGGRDITIALQSPGGEVMEGFSIANAISNYPGKVTVAVDSLAASIATVLMMRADWITANENATVMIHNAWTIAAGNANDFEMTADLLRDLDGRIAGEYANRSGRPADDFRAMMDSETHFTASAAMDVGLIDEVIAAPKRGKSQANAIPLASLAPGATCEMINACFAPDPPARAFPRRARAQALLASLRLRL